MTFAEEVWQRRPLLMKVARYDEDLVQETIIRAIKSEHSFKKGTNLDAWLVTILKHYRNDVRKKYRREIPALQYDPRYINPVGTAAIEAHEALESLPKKMTKPLIMAVVYGHSYADIAKKLDIHMGTVRTRIHRARRYINNESI